MNNAGIANGARLQKFDPEQWQPMLDINLTGTFLSHRHLSHQSHALRVGTMQANRGRDTGPELAIRSILHARGLRYRVNVPPPLNRRRRADIVLSRARLYVFIDGCFWHGCEEHFVIPKTRTVFWVQKIAENRARDRDTDISLIKLGLVPIRIWEHVDPIQASTIIVDEYREQVASI